MPHKVDFQVVHVSCEDDKYPSSELNSKKHGPLIQGWISQRFCLYPIDLIIQFEKKIVLKKVQLLSHQYLIASKIEFFIGDCPDENVSFEAAKYTRLGYIELSSNERTDFRARELKSVHVDAEGTFLKLVIHKNYVNKANLYNQVGLVALNVIGSNLNEEQQKPVEGGETSVVSSINRPDYISPLDDLAFAMYQDPEISQIIRNLDKKKNDCVLNEKFDEAKRLKQAITELQKIGERLARYDIEKRQAIDEEDYEKAKIKKQQMQQYRADTYKQLQENNLLDIIDLPLDTRELDSDRNLGRSKSSLSILSPKNPYNKGSMMGTTPLPNNNMNEPERAVTPYDDRLIPRLRHNRSRFERNDGAAGTSADNNNYDANGGANEAVVPGPAINGNGIETTGGGTEEYDIFDPLMDGTEEMTEREVREAALMNDYLGKQLVTKLYSKNFQNREEAIQEVFNNLSNYKGEKEDAKALMRAAAILVAKMSKDNVFSVFNNALKLFHFLLNDFAKQHAIGKQDMNYVLEKCLPVLIHRTGDSNARLRQRAHEYIVEMANFPEIKPLHTVPHYCSIPIKLHIAPRLALSRVEIIEDLMKSLGTKDNGLTAESVAKFCAMALEHTAGEVRELATKILISMYKENGAVVRRHLPPDNEMNRRNKKYRVLYDAFDGIDGKPIQTYDRQNMHSELTSTTPRFNRNSLRTPTKSKTPNRGTSMDRKTPMSMADESEYNPDNTCMFCGEVNEKFVKQGFEMHYWKSCPMLKQCSECKQVIEVAVQNEHLLTECQYKSQYKKCPRCTEAINVSNTQDNDFHFKQKQCQPVEKRGNKCPLCHLNIGTGEEVWKEHLMSSNGCPKNPRKSISNSLSTEAAANAPKKSVTRK